MTSAPPTTPDPDRPAGRPVSRLRRATERYRLTELPLAALRRMVIASERRLNPSTGGSRRARVVSGEPDPIAATYLTDGHPVVVQVPLSSIRWSRLGLRLDDPDQNPFLRTMSDVLAGSTSRYEGSALEAHFASWQPTDLGAVLGLVGPRSAGTGLGQPPAAVTLPWSLEAASFDPSERLALWDLYAQEFVADGERLTSAHGHKHFGPVDPRLGRAEFDRYTGLVTSIGERGFIPDSGGEYVGVQLLVSTSTTDWVAVITGPGLHRSVAAAAQGVDPLTVAIDKWPMVVHRDDAPWWPGVRSGIFTLDEALEVFDRFMSGRSPFDRASLAP